MNHKKEGMYLLHMIKTFKQISELDVDFKDVTNKGSNIQDTHLHLCITIH